MRVLHLSWEYPPVVHGGLGRHVDALSRAQALVGDDVSVLTVAADLTREPATRVSAPARERRAGVEVLRVPVPAVPDPVADLTAAMAGVQDEMCSAATGLTTDVVHAHDWMVADAAHRIARRLDRPMVLTVHATELGRRAGRLDGPVPAAVHAQERQAIAAAHLVVVCSAPMVDEVDAHGVDRGKVRVVPGAVEAQLWHPVSPAGSTARQPFSPPDGPLVVAAGRLEWEKGFSTLLRAVPRVLEAHPRCRVVLAGAGSYEPVLRRLADELGLDQVLSLPGPLSTAQLAALFAAAGAVVVPSRYEPFGLVALEAQAAGAPVVAARVGGLGEIVRDGVTGRSFAAGDVDHLAEILRSLLADPGAAHQLAAAGQAAAAERTWSSVAQSLAAVYREAQRPAS